MSNELELTSALSFILREQPWRMEPGSELQIRSQTVHMPESLGYVSMIQTCKASDLGNWHNHVRAQDNFGGLKASYHWRRDSETDLELADQVWDIIDEVKDHVYEAD